MKKIKNTIIDLLESKRKELEKNVIILDVICMLACMVILFLPNMSQIINNIIFAIVILVLYFNYFFNSIKRENIAVLKRNKLVSFILTSEDFHFTNLFFIEVIIHSLVVVNVLEKLSNYNNAIEVVGIILSILYIIIIVADIKVSRKIAKYFENNIIK